MCWIEGADSYTPLHEELRTARKPQRCGECHQAIQPGERYEHFAGVLDGRVDVWKTCEFCRNARSWLFQECGGWLYGGVWEELQEHWDDGTRTLELGRILVAERRRERVAA